MPVTHPRFAGCPQLVAASANSPPLKKGAAGDGVRRVQEALRDLTYPLPDSTRPDGTMDGVYGGETADTVWLFQVEHGLDFDGRAGTDTIARLEAELWKAAPSRRPKVEDGLPYHVRGPVRHLLQRDLEHPDVPGRPTDSLCWAAAYTTMVSWRDGVYHRPVDAIEKLGEPFATQFKFGQGMPGGQYQLLLARAKMAGAEHGTVPTAPGWLELLKKHGLLWVGAASHLGQNPFRHSFIIGGLFVSELTGQMHFKMHQPASSMEWNVSLATFNQMVRNEVGFHYAQIRYFAHQGRG